MPRRWQDLRARKLGWARVTRVADRKGLARDYQDAHARLAVFQRQKLDLLRQKAAAGQAAVAARAQTNEISGHHKGEPVYE